MNIQDFSRMKSYCKDGKISVILKLNLPRSDGENSGHTAFDSFYQKLFERYSFISENVSKINRQGASPMVVVVSFSVITEEYLKEHPNIKKKYKSLVAILREERVRVDGKVRRVEFVDLYDGDSDLFIKAQKYDKIKKLYSNGKGKNKSCVK